MMAFAPICFAQTDDLNFTVGRISFDRQPVFDLAPDGSWQIIPTTVNKIHIPTKERILINELLFSEGDPYSHDLVEETERNLRLLNIIGEVEILRDTIDNRTIDLTIYARDRWPYELGGTYKDEGNIRSYRLTLQDKNFLGNAQRVSLSFDSRSDRLDQDGVRVLFYERRLFGSRWGTLVQYRQAEEFDLGSLSLGRGYSTESTLWAAGTNYRNLNRLHYYYSEDQRIIYRQVRTNMDAWFSKSTGGPSKLRVSAAVLSARQTIVDLPSSPADNYSMLVFSFSPRYRVYEKVQYLDNFGRIEDLPLGYLANFAAGKNFYYGATNAPDYYLRGDLIYARYFQRKYYIGGRARLSTFMANGQPSEVILDLELRHHRKWSLRHTFAARLRYQHGDNWAAYRRLILGGANGLRGYDAYALSGRRLVLLNIEDRIFTPLKLWIFRFGAVAFADFGDAWDASEQFGIDQLHSSFGIGLRIENRIQSGSGILRIDFAFRPDKRGVAEVSITTNQLFSAFTAIGFIPPNVIQ
jgi:hypothetical protein